MKFKKWMKLIDPIVNVCLWTQDNEVAPAFEGSLLDVPWYFLDYEIGNVGKSNEQPIYITEKTNKHGVTLSVIVINLIAK